MLLSVRNLRVSYARGPAQVHAVDGVSFDVDKGQVVALVGESGSGKSTVGLTIMNLLPPAATVSGGSVLLNGTNMLGLDQGSARALMGKQVGMIFQEPVSYLNPVLKVGDQIAESLRIHEGLAKSEARSKAITLLQTVRVSDAERVYDHYPHQLSGGMAQRACIAVAVACRPALLIADEPTSSLDLTIQVQILHLLKRLREEMGMSILLISHDLRAVSGIADDVVVMYAGKVAEEAKVTSIFREPRHPYTRVLLKASKIGEPDPAFEARGSLPDLTNPPPGCRFAPRCPVAFAKCAQDPVEYSPAGGSRVYCWLYGEGR